MFALFAALSPLQQAQTPQATLPNQVQPSLSALFGVAPTLAEPSRLEMTPGMNGKIENEDWDVLSGGEGTKSYFQWAPGIIYVAGIAPVGSDLLLSLDLGNDGWLVGSDNYEARVKSDANGNATVTVRRLNANNVAGPTWEDLPGWAIASVCKATVNGSSVEYELQLSDAGVGALPRSPQRIGGRVDMINSNEPPVSSTQPRLLAPLSLVQSRAEGLPSNMRYEVDRATRPEVAGQSASIRFDFSVKPGSPATSPSPGSPPPAAVAQPLVKRISIAAEGEMRSKMSEMNSPFPAFDKSGRASVDYVSKIAIDSDPGYHVLKCTLLLGDDTPATLESSFKIAEPISVKIVKPFIPVSVQDRSVTVGFNIQSFSPEPARGTLTFTMDPTFRVLNRTRDTYRFTLEPNGRTSDKFQIYVPANSAGTYPVAFDLVEGGMKRHFVEYITFGFSPAKSRRRN
jgi:hypothetical protein